MGEEMSEARKAGAWNADEETFVSQTKKWIKEATAKDSYARAALHEGIARKAAESLKNGVEHGRIGGDWPDVRAAFREHEDEIVAYANSHTPFEDPMDQKLLRAICMLFHNNNESSEIDAEACEKMGIRGRRVAPCAAFQSSNDPSKPSYAIVAYDTEDGKYLVWPHFEGIFPDGLKADELRPGERVEVADKVGATIAALRPFRDYSGGAEGYKYGMALDLHKLFARLGYDDITVPKEMCVESCVPGLYVVGAYDPLCLSPDQGSVFLCECPKETEGAPDSVSFNMDDRDNHAFYVRDGHVEAFMRLLSSDNRFEKSQVEMLESGEFSESDYAAYDDFAFLNGDAPGLHGPFLAGFQLARFSCKPREPESGAPFDRDWPIAYRTPAHLRGSQADEQPARQHRGR